MLFQEASHETAHDDSDLLSRMRAGDAEAWNTVAAVIRPRLRRLASSALPARILVRLDASDMVQQTLLEADASHDAFAGSSLPELYAWLAVILKHNVSDAVRRHLLAQSRTVRMECQLQEFASAVPDLDEICVADQTSPSMAAAREETQVRLLLAIESLPPRQREAVRMRHFEGLPMTDIAAKLSCTVPGAAAVIARGLQGLRHRLRDVN